MTPIIGAQPQTGLLTRFVPEKLKHTAFYRWLLRFTRIIQFLSATISLGIFSSRVYKIYRLVNSVKTSRGVSKSFGAVEGILSAAVAYTLIAMLFGCIKRNSSPGKAKWIRWLWVVLDLAFVGAFIAVAVLTRPNGGSAGPRRCYQSRNVQDVNNATGETASQDKTCNLPWGTFILAIVSTLLHAITAAFHEVQDHRHKRRSAAEEEKAIHNGQTPDHNYDGQGFAGNLNGQSHYSNTR
ncbi:hypothetical protein P154DRAFT_605030 [Amniculicola lignicola CBS 123094]|uniref:MARVEL domain-containing protein n=1 Tax=Amniculicola lignicola CBS 123094 TaxID=1392246 RepID=A0A6A5WAG8_9PLEO|nr:hypothetical protein P154DRAFT_605030 [Amniculicola lignicola CBS 123094]